jgi:hypothetical protein
MLFLFHPLLVSKIGLFVGGNLLDLLSGKHSLTSSLLSWIRLAGKRPVVEPNICLVAFS